MRQVILDKPTQAKLQDLTELLEIRDESGRILGHFLPLDRPTVLADDLRSCPHSDEEIRQLQRQTGGRPLAEIWPDLGRRP